MKLNVGLQSNLLSPFEHLHHSAHSHPYLAHLIPGVCKAVVYIIMLELFWDLLPL